MINRNRSAAALEKVFTTSLYTATQEELLAKVTTTVTFRKDRWSELPILLPLGNTDVLDRKSKLKPQIIQQLMKMVLCKGEVAISFAMIYTFI